MLRDAYGRRAYQSGKSLLNGVKARFSERNSSGPHPTVLFLVEREYYSLHSIMVHRKRDNLQPQKCVILI